MRSDRLPKCVAIDTEAAMERPFASGWVRHECTCEAFGGLQAEVMSFGRYAISAINEPLLAGTSEAFGGSVILPGG
jgi:hypothetical protein